MFKTGFYLEILGEKTDIANTISYENEPPELVKGMKLSKH